MHRRSYPFIVALSVVALAQGSAAESRARCSTGAQEITKRRAISCAEAKRVEAAYRADLQRRPGRRQPECRGDRPDYWRGWKITAHPAGGGSVVIIGSRFTRGKKSFVVRSGGACGSASSAEARSRYCSPTGDVCYGAYLDREVVTLRIGLQARYFDRYRLCVAPPRGSRECRRFRIRERGTLYGSSVRWDRHFTDHGAGTYRVTWAHSAGRMGPGITFRRG